MAECRQFPPIGTHDRCDPPPPPGRPPPAWSARESNSDKASTHPAPPQSPHRAQSIFNLLIRQLPIPGNQRPTIMMRRQHPPPKNIKRHAPSTDPTNASHHKSSPPAPSPSAPSPPLTQRPIRRRPIRILPNSIMRQPHRAQSQIPPLLHMLHRHNRIGPLHAQNKSKRSFLRLFQPFQSQCDFQLSARANHPHMPLLLQQFVIRQLRMRRRICDRLRRKIQIRRFATRPSSSASAPTSRNQRRHTHRHHRLAAAPPASAYFFPAPAHRSSPPRANESPPPTTSNRD
jgi:hypothetical protein